MFDVVNELCTELDGGRFVESFTKETKSIITGMKNISVKTGLFR